MFVWAHSTQAGAGAHWNRLMHDLPKDVHILHPEPVNVILVLEKGSLLVWLRILRWGDSLEYLRCPKYHHKCPYEKETKGDHTDRRAGGHVTEESENGVMWAHGKECQQPPGAGEGRNRFSPSAFWGSMTKTLISAQVTGFVLLFHFLLF